MIGILTEKPSAARNFASALGGIKGSFNGEDYVIVPARGHVFSFTTDLEKQVSPSLAQKYKSWKIKDLPWDYKDIKWARSKGRDTSSVISSLKSTLSKCDEIAIATDVDPTGEGQLIAWEIIEELRLENKKISRLYFLDETKKSLQDAFIKRDYIASKDSDLEYQKALYRSKFDFLTMQFTRIAFDLTGDVLRQGRLKSAMISIVGEGLEEYNNYKKIPFYEVRFKDEFSNVFTDSKAVRFKTKDEASKQIDNFKPSLIEIDSRVVKKKAPDKLIDLSTLSSMLSSKNIKAKEVLSTYQKMYEDQVVSYPRTEDKFISPEQFNEMLPLVDSIASVVGVDVSLLTHRKPRPTHVKEGGAHGANRPGKNVPTSLAVLEKYGRAAKDIYIILAKNYLSMLCEDYEYEQVKCFVKDYHSFKSTINIPLKKGYKEVFSTDDDEEVSLKLGDTALAFVHEGFPPRHPYPTMKWLMKRLEVYNVGTGATKTSTYADITDSRHKYPLLTENKGKISMTDFGLKSFKIIRGTNIGSVKLTESVQENMKLIGEGKAKAEDFLDISSIILDDVKTMRSNATNEGVCKVQDKEKFEGFFEKDGVDVSFNRTWGGYTFTDEECLKLLKGEKVTIQSKGVTGELAKQEYKGYSYYGFKKCDSEDRYYCDFDGKRISFKKVWSNHEFTEDECKSLANGNVITFEVSGKSYTAVKGKLEEQEYNGHKFYGFKATEFIR